MQTIKVFPILEETAISLFVRHLCTKLVSPLKQAITESSSSCTRNRPLFKISVAERAWRDEMRREERDERRREEEGWRGSLLYWTRNRSLFGLSVGGERRK
jgi:hypothetical protein